MQVVVLPFACNSIVNKLPDRLDSQVTKLIIVLQYLF